MAPRMMAVLHPAFLFHAPQHTEVCKSDWQRVGKFLDSTWPQPMPEIHEWTVSYTPWEHYGSHQQFIAVDTEYNPETKELLLLGFGAPGLPIIQWWPKRATAASRREVAASFKVLMGENIAVFQNCMADIPVLEKALGIRYADYRRVDDTLFLHSLLWCEMPHDLEFMASVYGQHEKMKHLPMTDPLYNAGDVVETIAVWEALVKECKHDPQTWWLYENSLLPLVPIILEAQQRGLKVDRRLVKEAQDSFDNAKTAATHVAEGSSGFPINMGSPKQLKDFLNATLGKRLKSVDEDNIAKLRASILPFDPEEENTVETMEKRIQDGGHPLLEARVLYARAQQYLSHYVRPMLESSDGRVYPQFHPWAQNTGRWSTVNPPLAQLPSSLRESLVPDTGWQWFEFDFSSIELRIMAALTGDTMLLDAFAKDWDVHTVNMCQFFGYRLPEKLTKSGIKECTEWAAEIGFAGSDDPRRVFAKTMVYRLCYGGQPRGAPSIPGAASIGVSSADLVRAAQRWINAHPAIKRYWGAIERGALKSRQLRTFLGRRWNFLSHDLKRVQRQMADFPLQGAVADILNITLIRIVKVLSDRVRLGYQMHDSLKLQVKITENLEADIQTVIRIAEQPWMINNLEVVIPVEWHQRH